jgi:hypothetical protein
MTPIERYLRCLDAGDAEGAAALFTEDAIYVRPKFEAGVNGRPATFGGLVLVRGREAILRSFRERGKQEYRHVVLATATVGARCFVEMTLGGFGSGLESLATADLEGDLISRYVALSAPVDPDVANQLFPPGTSS